MPTPYRDSPPQAPSPKACSPPIARRRDCLQSTERTASHQSAPRRRPQPTLALESSSTSKAGPALSPASPNEACENDEAATPKSPAPAVAIAAPEDLFGRTFDVVIFGGFVNGFIPSRDMCDSGVVVGGARTRQEAADRAAIALAEHRATKRLLFTSFESCDLETAERLRLHIPRIHLRSGVRTCDIHPSDYLQELGLR